jgi:WD40 repeat protein
LIAPLVGVKGIVQKAEFAPDGQSIVTVALDGLDGVIVSDPKTGAVISNLSNESYDLPNSASYLGMGDRIATAWGSGIVKISETTTGHTLATLNDCVGASPKIFSSPDRGRFFLACNGNGAIYDSMSLAVMGKLAGPSVAAEAVFSPDNSLLTTVGWNGLGELWDGGTGEKFGDLTGHTDGILAVDVSAKNEVITASHDRTVRLWNATPIRGRVLGRFGDQKNNEAALTGAPSLSSDGKELIIIGKGYLQVLSLDGLEEHDLVGDDTIVFARFCEARKSVVALAYSGDLLVISNPDNRTIARIKQKTTAASCSPKGELIAAGDQQGWVKVFDAKTGLPVKVLGQFPREVGQFAREKKVEDITFSPDGAFVAAAAGGTVKIWRLDSTAEPSVTFEDQSPTVRSIQFSPDGAEIAVSGDVGVPAKVFDTSNGQLKLRLLDAAEIHHSVSFSPDNGQWIITSRGKSATVWDGVTGAALSLYGPHATDVIWASASLTSEGKSVLTASRDGEIRAWNATELETKDAFHVACTRFLNTQTLDSVAREFGLRDIKPICDAGTKQYLPASLERGRIELTE